MLYFFVLVAWAHCSHRLGIGGGFELQAFLLSVWHLGLQIEILVTLEELHCFAHIWELEGNTWLVGEWQKY